MTQTSGFAYKPGECNIDDRGVRMRRNLGLVCLVAGVVSLVAMYWVGFPMGYRVFVIAGFGFATSLNFFQATDHFCVSNATTRTTEVGLKRSKIVDDLYKELDLKKRNAMLLKALAVAALSACLGLLPI